MRFSNLYFTKSHLYAITAAVFIGGCSNSETASATGGNSTETQTDTSTTTAATRIFKNGDIYTVNTEQVWAEAMALQGNKIVYVGSNTGVDAYLGNNTQVTDLNGKMVIPGIHDVHIHPIESASDNTQFALDSTEMNAENFADAIADAAAQNPNANWLIGYGHTISALLDSNRAPRDIIDDVVSDRPVIIMEQSSHSMWVNSAALEIAGIDIDTPDPQGGVIVRDEITEQPNGILMDNAGDMVMHMAMQPTAQRQQNDYQGLIEFVQPEMAKHGITSISDARSYWRRDDHLTWIKARNNNALTLRVNVGLWAYPELSDEMQLANLKSLYSNDADSLLKFNQIKLYSDGIVINGTAAMHEPYNIDLLGLAGNNGLNYFDQNRLAHYLKELESIGYDFHIHAIGDRGIHEALNAIENAGTDKGRHRITHIEVMDPADYPRFAALNVTADAQVAGEFSNPSHWNENHEMIGAERSQDIIPIKSLVQAGARLTLSSDWNVSTYNPFVGIQHAVTRKPQEITLAEAIKAYTINGAYTMRQEDKVGSIEVGKLADFVILNQNLFEIPKTQINQTKVIATYLNGEAVYQR